MLLSSNNLLVASLLLTAVYIAKIVFFNLRNPLNKVPGPFLAKFTNLRLKIAVISGRRIYYIDSLHKKYGTYVRIFPDEITVNDPKGFKVIQSIGSDFEKSPWYDNVTILDRPAMFVMTDAKSHAARRKLFARGFSKSNIRQNWESRIREKVELAVMKMREEAARFGGKADVMKWWTLMASDVSSHLLLGESFHTLDNGEVNEYIRTLTSAMKGNGIGVELPFVRAIGRHLPIQAAKELWNTNDFLDDYARAAVRDMRARQQTKTVFAHIAAEAEKGETLDERDVEIETIALFIAGTDTTAVTLTYLLWAVIARPALRRECEGEVATLPESYVDADVEQLPLLNAIIEETLRLYDAAPGGLPRIVSPGGIDLGGYYLPQGSTVSTHSYSMHRDSALFPDPMEFKTSRWIASHEDYVSDAAKAVFAPFGAGTRGCIGTHIAYSEMRLAVAEFLEIVRVVDWRRRPPRRVWICRTFS